MDFDLKPSPPRTALTTNSLTGTLFIVGSMFRYCEYSYKNLNVR